MATTVKAMLAEAEAAVPRMTPAEAVGALEAGGRPLVLDVRDPGEVARSGRIKGALNVPRGLLEFRADPESPYHDEAFAKDRPVLVYCASGGRSALAGKTLREMGFGDVRNLGGFKDLAEAGAPTEPAAPAAGP